MEPKRVFDLLYFQAEKYPSERSLNAKKNGKWKNYSTQTIISIVNKISIGLLKSDLKKGDKIAIMASNCPEWNFIDFGAQQVGVIVVPIYPTSSIKDFQYIFEHSGSKKLFLGDKMLYDKTSKLIKELAIDAYSFCQIEGIKHWTELTNFKKEKENKEILENYKNSVQQEDLFTIIYTSGTTGKPKGVMLTHSNVISNALSVSDRLNLDIGKDKILSFLPISHVYERTCIYIYIYFGLKVFYAESLEKIVENIQEIKPHGFGSVPRLLEKVYDKIIEKGEKLDGIKRLLFFWAVNLGLKYNPNKKRGIWYNFKLRMARKLIFSKWKKALGGEVKMILSGGTAIQPRLLKIFWAADIKICEGYGLTETSPIISASIPNEGGVRIGCVGIPIKNAQVKIAKDGEILCKGPMVMKGYYKEQEMTSQVIKDGWLYTGDIGEFVEGKYLKITDRKKEIFKTSGGKYIAPQLLENKIKESSMIEQVLVIGENRKCPAALIVPNFETLKKWCERQEINTILDRQALIKNQQVIDKLQKEIDKANQDFGQWEKIKIFRLLDKEWSIDSGETTPKMSLKRKVILEENKELIEEMYQ